MSIPRSQPLSIIVVGPTYPFRGGISHYTTLLVQHLRERHTVRLLTFRRQYPAWLFPGRSDRDEASQAALRVDGEAMLDGVNPWTWWRAAWAIRRTVPALLVAQWTVPFWAPMLWLLLGLAPSGTRTVLICHNASPHEAGHPLMARLARWAQRAVMARADQLICHAESDERELRAMLPDKPIVRVMLPSYAGLVEASERGGRPEPRAAPPVGSPHLLFFGFVRPYKGVDTLLRAMPLVLAALPDAHLTIAGEWWRGTGGPEQWMDPAIRGAVTVLDRYISNEEMVALFRAADGVVLPYRSATQSAVVQLAFGFGIPVITTTVGGLPEAVEHERSGLLVPPDDPAALADALIRYHREGWRERLAPGVAAARARFSWAALVGVLERLAGEATKRTRGDGWQPGLSC